MTERILIPLDGSETAEAILPQVRRFLQRHGAEVLLLQVAPSVAPDFHFAVPGQSGEVTAYVRKRAFELINDGIPARALLRHGNAAEQIVDTAAAEGATMIAMSTHGRSGLNRFVFGSVAEKVLRASGVPVLVVRSFPRTDLSRGRLEELPFHRILVPLDGSPSSAGVVPLVLSVARPLDAQVTLLHIDEPDVPAPHWPPADEPMLQAEQALKEACIPCQRERRQGDPASEILKFAEEQSTDLIVIGTHGRSGPSRWVFGSVTEKVLRSSPIPLLIAHRSPARKEEPAARRESSAILPPT